MKSQKTIRSSLNNNAVLSALLVGLLIAAAMWLTKYLVSVIPVSEGFGWDGSNYFAHIWAWGHGKPLADDPYHELRMGSFIPVILGVKFGVARLKTLTFQVIVNVVILAVGGGLFFDFLRKMGATLEVAILSTATLVFSWPFLVMPVYYRFLTDHLALAIACASLWAWARKLRFVLPALSVWSFFVLPGLFVVPLILSVMPNGPVNTKPRPDRIAWLKYAPNIVFLTIGTALTIALLANLLYYADEAMLGDDNGITFAQPQLRYLSMGISCILCMGVSYIWAHLFFNKRFWRLVDFRILGLNLAVIVITAIMIYGTFGWNDFGFKGPDLISNLYLESLAAPGKPLAAHFVYFGPVFFMALTALPLTYRQDPRAPWPLIAILIAFLPALAFGSESRQWIGIFPVVVGIFGLSKHLINIRRLVLLFSVGLCLPAFGLKTALHQAMDKNMQYNAPEFQYYFGYQGPWMSPHVYCMSVKAIMLFLSATAMIMLYERKLKFKIRS